jgi:1D-myo-inositol-tetrakisphosphate 5-kinase/inositol-polyphosphate multikinase
VDDSEGVLSDASGDLVIKPCTQAEVSFYELANKEHQDFAFYMPRFMGTLQLGNQTPALSAPPVSTGGTSAPMTIADTQALAPTATHAPSSSVPGIAASAAISELGPLKGKKLDTDLHIVLENVSAGFAQPNILDLKLGARLWDDDAKLDKRERLDKVANETTSGSLGFRIAGMRVWQGEKKADPLVAQLDDVVAAANSEQEQDKYSKLEEASNHKSYNKFYGRQFSAETVLQGFKEYFLVPSAGITEDHARIILWNFLEEVKDIEKILMQKESRMYSASLLFVYEGHPDAFKTSFDAITNAPEPKPTADDDEEDEEEEERPKVHAVKLIDFAHAQFQEGLGPDENMLTGVRSTIRVLEMLLKEISA